MGYLTTALEWHDLRVDPEDLPDSEEPIVVTIELLNGERVTWLDVYLKDCVDKQGNPTGTYLWVTKALNEYNEIEETQVWYKVVAWAYPPPPFEYY